MNVLFAHNNFPGQFGYLAHHLAKFRGHRVVAIGSDTARPVPEVVLHKYRIKRSSTHGIHDYAVRFEADCIRGEAAASTAMMLAREGFIPDVIVAHGGFGDALFLKDIWPRTKVMIHAEYYYRTDDEQFCFDPEFQSDDMANKRRAHAKNAGFAMAVGECDLAIAPTEFQRSRFPIALRKHIEVVHEGIDTDRLQPRSGVQFAIPGTQLVLSQEDEVLTYINRHLEPLRGLHIFMRALPEILQQRQQAQVLIVGDDGGTPYGRAPPRGMKWRQILFQELGDRVDKTRIHFLGRIEPRTLADVYAISRAHVYLSYPFVLSWSMLEAMSSGCLVIASKTEAVEEVITDRQNGLLVDFFDSSALAKTAADVLSSPIERFHTIRQNARQTVRMRYDRNSVCMPQLVKLIEGLASP